MRKYICILAILLLLHACGETENKNIQKGNSDPQGARKTLSQAVKYSNLKEIQKLLAATADINAVDEEGKTLLDVALENRRWEAARLLCKHDARTRTYIYATLAAAAKVGDIDAVGELLAAGSDPNERQDRWTSLHYACRYGDLKLAELLLDYSADISARLGYEVVLKDSDDPEKRIVITRLHGGILFFEDQFGPTPLHFAAENGHLETVQLLVDRGCEVNPFNNKWETPLDVAKTEDMKQFLRSYGAISGKDLKEGEGK